MAKELTEYDKLLILMNEGFQEIRGRFDAIDERIGLLEVTTREGFRNVNEVLADHTERLKNVEKAQHPVAGDGAGVARADGD